MTTQHRVSTKPHFDRLSLWAGHCFGAGQAVGGGLHALRRWASDVGLASAGWGARAQDARPYSQPGRHDAPRRLAGSAGSAGALRRLWVFDRSGTSSDLGSGDGQSDGWFPAAARFSVTALRHLIARLRMTGNFGLSRSTMTWVGRYYVQEATSDEPPALARLQATDNSRSGRA